MLILTWTDPHVTRACEFAAPTEDGYNEYLQLVLKSFDFVASEVIRHKPDVMSFHGDFHDGRDYVDTMSLAISNKIWDLTSRLPVKYKRAIPGNHDYFDVTHNIHTLDHLRSRGWKVFDTITVEQLEDKKFLWLPFRDSYDLDQLRAIFAENKIDFVGSHMDVVGALRRNPKNEKDTKAFSENGVPPAILADAGVVLNGHYHHPSQVTPNFYNVGSLTSRTFHDQDSPPRGITLYDTETKQFTRINNPYARQFVELRIETEAQLDALLTEEQDTKYAKIYYSRPLEEKVVAAKEFFAGSRLLPLPQKRIVTEESKDAVDVRFSLEENLKSYIDTTYPNHPDWLSTTAQSLLKDSMAEAGSVASQVELMFGKISIRNLLSVSEIDFDLKDQGLIFVQGVNDDDPSQQSNGAGKSGFIEAPYWALTGISLRGLKGDEVINWNATWCRVSLEVICPDATYTIVRSRNDPELVIEEGQAPRKRGTGVWLFKNGQNVSARLAADTEKKIRELIGRSDENLLHTVWLTATMASSFSKLSYAQRAQLLEEVIGSTPFKFAQAKAKQRVESLYPALMTCDARMQQLTLSLKEAEDQKSLLEFDLRDLTAKSVLEASQIKEEYDRIVLQRAEAQLSIQDTLTKLTQMEEHEKLLQGKIQAFGELREKLMGTISEKASAIAVLKEYDTRIATLLGQERCPMCEEPVSRTKFVQKLDDNSHARRTLDEEHNCLRTEYVTHGERVKILQDALAQKSQQRRILANTHLQLTSHEASLARRMDELVTLQERLAYSRRSLEASMEQKCAAITKYRTDIELVSTERQELTTQKQWLEILQSDVFSERGVRNAILAQVAIPYINTRLPEYTAYFLGGKDILLTGDRPLKSGELRNEIDIQLSGKRTYKSNSLGEKRRTDLPIQFAIGDLAAACGHPVNFLVVDEVLDPLDESGLYAAKEVLRKRSERGTVLMVSHSKYAAAIVPRKVVLYKKGDCTTILEQKVEDGLQY